MKANATTLTSLMKDWKIVRTLVDTILAAMNNSSVNSNPSASRKENIVYVLKVLQDILDDVPSVGNKKNKKYHLHRKSDSFQYSPMLTTF